MVSAPARSTHSSSCSRISSSRSSSWVTSAARPWSLNSSAEYASPTAASDTFFISTSTSTARSRSVIAGFSSTAAATPRGRTRELAELVDAVARAAQDQHVVGEHELVAVGVDDPVAAAPDRDDRACRRPSAARPLRARRPASCEPARTRTRCDTSSAAPRSATSAAGMPRRCVTTRLMSTAALPMRSIADTTCSTPAICSASRFERPGEHAHLAHLVHELVETLLELGDFVGHALVREEQRGVAEVDHELGGVFRLREHGLQISWSVVHRHRFGSVGSLEVRSARRPRAPG